MIINKKNILIMLLLFFGFNQEILCQEVIKNDQQIVEQNKGSDNQTVYISNNQGYDYEKDRQNQIKYIKKLINEIKKKIYILIYEKPEEPTEQEKNILESLSYSFDKDFLKNYENREIKLKKYSDFRKDLIDNKKDFLDFDLHNMKLTFYVKGKKDSVEKISGKGRPGSWWETPPGLYHAQDKRRMVELTLSDKKNPIYMPNAVRFSGLFFVHRWPEYKNGKPLPGFYTEGCIRLNKKVSEKVYNFVKPGTPILMYDEKSKNENFYGDYYKDKINDKNIISSTKYFIADLDDNKILLSKNKFKKVYLNDITKLIFMLTATEWIEVKEQHEANWLNTVDQYFPGTKLKEGIKYSLLDLGALMLAEKSKSANEEIADRIWDDEIRLMNSKSKSIGMTDFKYTNYVGDKKENISSMADIFYLFKNLYLNRSFILDMTLNKAYNKKYRKNIFAGKLEVKNFWKNLMGFKGGITGTDWEGKEYGAGIFEIKIKNQKRNILFVIYKSKDLKKDFELLKGFVKFYYDR